MPIKFTENHICDFCGYSFEWNYFELYRDRMGAPFYRVDSKPLDKCYTVEFKPQGNGVYNVVVNCPKCKKENRFQFIQKWEGV